MSRLKRNFFEQNTVAVAQNLLGKFLVRKYRGKKIEGMIVETEAYHGFSDLASHASGKRTKRNEVMFDKAGLAYVYLIYGMYYCFNVVTGLSDFPAAVLIRAIETKEDKSVTNGPGKLSKYLKIDKNLNRCDLTLSDKLSIQDKGIKIKNEEIISSRRVGVDYAKECANWKWRFFVRNNRYVSRF